MSSSIASSVLRRTLHLSRSPSLVCHHRQPLSYSSLASSPPSFPLIRRAIPQSLRKPPSLLSCQSFSVFHESGSPLLPESLPGGARLAVWVSALDHLTPWSTDLSAVLYKIDGWGALYFSVNAAGNIAVRSHGVHRGDRALLEMVPISANMCMGCLCSSIDITEGLPCHDAVIHCSGPAPPPASFPARRRRPRPSLPPLLQGPRTLFVAISTTSSATVAGPPSSPSSSPISDPLPTTPPLATSSVPPTPSSSSRSLPTPNLTAERSLPSPPSLPHPASPSPSPPARMPPPVIASPC